MEELRDISRDEDVLAVIRSALEADIGRGDVTTEALVPEDAGLEARVVAGSDCVVAGVGVAQQVFLALDGRIECGEVSGDSCPAPAGTTVLTVSGPACPILTAERTALNFLQRMSGIATLTREFVDRVSGRATILDTRKTTPGLRKLEKYAVVCGGGRNHRFGLHDRVLIKDNHLAVWGEATGSSVGDAVRSARASHPGMVIEVEVETESDLEGALDASPDWILLDNMSPAELKRCVEKCSGRCSLEASGGITIENVSGYADTGVDAISLGCLTHSAPAADFSLDFTRIVGQGYGRRGERTK
ncbi:carboxylating nicotinate-nucleotide diphosphorylase [Verrucomicrobiota bacterium]